MEQGEEGHKFSFIYPKKSYEANVNLKSTTLHKHMISIGSLLQSFTRIFMRSSGSASGASSSSGGFPFGKPKSATTEAPLDFSSEDMDDDFSSSSNGKESSSSTTEDVSDFDVRDEVNDEDGFASTLNGKKSNGHSSSSGSSSSANSGSKVDSGHKTKPSVIDSYLPPLTSRAPPVTAYLPPTLKPSKYLPPTTKAPSAYLPPK